MLLIKVLISLIVLYISIRLYNWRKNRKRLVELIEKLPGPPNLPYTPFINHALSILYVDSLKHELGTYAIMYQLVSNIYKVFSEEGICRFWLGWRPLVMLYEPDLVESILSSTSVIDKAHEYRYLEPWIGEGLITSKKTKWRFRRKILTPAFHFRILNDFLPIMNQEASKLVRKFNQRKFVAAGHVFDVTPLIALCTLDTICETAMGVNINSQDDEDSPYVKALAVTQEIAVSRVTRPWLWSDFIFYRTAAGRQFSEANKLMHDFSMKVIRDRKEAWKRQLNADGTLKGTSADDQSAPIDGSNDDQTTRQEPSYDKLRESAFFRSTDRRLAFLDILIHQHIIAKTMSLEDVREEVDTFMFAGHDTTAMNISWSLYMLGLHEDIQQQARDELDRVLMTHDTQSFDYPDDHPDAGVLARKLDTTDITTDQIRELKYLDRVVKEALRMWPSVPFVGRQMNEDLLVGGKYLIPKGASCVVLTHALHQNPKYFPKPEIFDPDRFSPENSIGRHPFAYVPFSAGPRNCIGQKYALMEVKVILAKIIKNYIIKTHDHRDKLAIVGEVVIRSRNGLNISLTPRFK